MFTLVKMKDTIRIPPSMFDVNLLSAIQEQLSLKLANKVVINIGLCIDLFEVTKMCESHIFRGDGASYTTVYFSYVVFRPFINEVIVGRIRSCGREGVHVSLGFFDDILIPNDHLQHPSRFDETEQLWVWEYTNEESGERHDLFMDQDELIRFRVIEENFVDTSPTGPRFAESGEPDEDKRVPYSILGSASDFGLGLLSWWS